MHNKMSEDLTQRLCFIQRGEHGMQVEIVGEQQTLMSMFHSALMSNAELRQLLMPVMMRLMKDDDFIKLGIDDMMNTLKRRITGDDSDKDENTLDTN